MPFTTMSCIMGTSIDEYKPFWLPACFVRINSLSPEKLSGCVKKVLFISSVASCNVRCVFTLTSISALMFIGIKQEISTHLGHVTHVTRWNLWLFSAVLHPLQLTGVQLSACLRRICSVSWLDRRLQRSVNWSQYQRSLWMSLLTSLENHVRDTRWQTCNELVEKRHCLDSYWRWCVMRLSLRAAFPRGKTKPVLFHACSEESWSWSVWDKELSTDF